MTQAEESLTEVNARANKNRGISYGGGSIKRNCISLRVISPLVLRE